jgi:NADH:ubiquinone oxidoreductase subunit 4 (subunit M)
MLIYTVFVLPIWGMISLFFTNSSHYLRLKQIALGFSIITFYFSLLLWVLFDKGSVYFQYLGVLP